MLPPRAQMRRRGHLACDEIFGHGGEILVGAVAVLLERRTVPSRAVFAAAADVGHHVHPAALQPGRRLAAEIARQQRHFKPAVAIQQRRRAAVRFEIFGGNLEIRYAGAVLGTRKMLAHR